jgi:hypothetical protein
MEPLAASQAKTGTYPSCSDQAPKLFVLIVGPEARPVASVLLWKIAPAYRIADGSGTYLFHYAVKLALDLVQAAEDQGETVGGGHWGPGQERKKAPAIDGQGKLKQSGTEWSVRPCPLYIHW